MTPEFARLAHGRVLQYHNVTPAHFFAGYDAAIYRLAMLGRDELKSLAGHTDDALGDSEYNRQELESLGFTNTGVFPIAVDTGRIGERIDVGTWEGQVFVAMDYVPGKTLRAWLETSGWVPKEGSGGVTENPVPGPPRNTGCTGAPRRVRVNTAGVLE